MAATDGPARRLKASQFLAHGFVDAEQPTTRSEAQALTASSFTAVSTPCLRQSKLNRRWL